MLWNPITCYRKARLSGNRRPSVCPYAEHTDLDRGLESQQVWVFLLEGGTGAEVAAVKSGAAGLTCCFTAFKEASTGWSVALSLFSKS